MLHEGGQVQELLVVNDLEIDEPKLRTEELLPKHPRSIDGIGIYRLSVKNDDEGLEVREKTGGGRESLERSHDM
jgi:hypothetical protein